MHQEVITLSGAPLATGRTRLVYAHPERSDCLIKVMRPEFIELYFRQAQPFLKRYKLWRRTGYYTIYLRELNEFLAVHARFPEQPSPLVPILGTVATNLGLGQIVSKVVDKNGGMAPTIKRLVQSEGLSDELMGQLKIFSARLHACDVIVHDLNPGNVLQHDDNGKKQLILVDGFGERNVIPVCTISRYYNRINTEKYFSRMMSVLRKIASSRPAT